MPLMPSWCPYKAVVMAALQWLVALVVLCAAAQGRGECITGLVDTATLALWSEQYGAPIDLEEQSNVQYIFPEIQFRCTGTVTKWIIGAEFNIGGGNIPNPIMGAYRDIGVANQYTRMSRRLFLHPTESFSRLYEFIPPNPQPFQSGDILGLFQPSEDDSRLQLLFGDVDGATPSFSRNGGADFDANGLSPFNTAGAGLSTQTDRLPLVAVEIESDDPDSADCTRDFISRDLLELLLVPSLNERQNQANGRQFVFPSYSFSCAGLITSWSLGLVELRGGGNRNNFEFPQLQIWRRSISGDLYDRIASTELTAAPESLNQLYSVTIDPPLQFQSGDLLGMFVPRAQGGNGQLRVMFGQNAGPTYRFADSAASLTSLSVDGDSDNDRPFLALEMSIIPTSSPPSIWNSMGSTTATPASTTVTVSVTTAVTPAPSLSPPTTGMASMSPPTTGETSASPPTTGETSASPPITAVTPAPSLSPPTTGMASMSPPTTGETSASPPTTGETSASPPTTGETSASPPITAVTSVSPPTELLPVIAVGASVGGVVLAAVVTVLIIVAAVACARKKNRKPTDKSMDAIDMTATAEETYYYPFQHETTAISTEHNVYETYASTAITTEQNEAYASTAITTEQNEAYASTAITTKQNEAYALPTAPNAAYSSSTAVPLQSNEAYATTRGGDTATDEYEYI